MEKTQENSRKEKQGVVVSDKMEKTVVVRVDTTMRHPDYKKVISRSKKFYAHNEIEGVAMGDTVIIRETRPLSKMKRWRVVERVNK